MLIVFQQYDRRLNEEDERRRTVTEDRWKYVILKIGYKNSKNLYLPKTSISWKQPNKLISSSKIGFSE